MSGLFNHNNLLLCGTQGNNELLAKTFKKFSKSPLRLAGSHFWQAPNLQGELSVFERTLIELRFNIIKNLLCLFFI